MQFDPQTRYEIKSVVDGRCLSIAEGELDDGTAVHLWNEVEYSEVFNQWQIIDLQPGVVEIVSEYNGKCLNLAAGDISAHAAVHLWDEAGSGNLHNRWRIHESSRPGVFEIQSLYSGRFLSAAGGEEDDGAELHVDHDAIGQSPWNEWFIHENSSTSSSSSSPSPTESYLPASVGKCIIVNAFSGLVVDNPGGNGTAIIAYEIHGKFNQLWSLVPAGGGLGDLADYGYVKIMTCNRDGISRYLTVLDDSNYVGLRDESATDVLTQCWRVQQQKPSFSRITAAFDGRVMGLENLSLKADVDENNEYAVRVTLGEPIAGGAADAYESDLDPAVLAQLWRLPPSPALPLPFCSPHEIERHHSYSYDQVQQDGFRDALTSLTRHGFVVINDVLSQDDVVLATRRFGDDLMGIIDTAALAENPSPAVHECFGRLRSGEEERGLVAESWPATSHPPKFHPNNHGLAQGSCVWGVRGNERVRRVYAALYGEGVGAPGVDVDDLCGSMDMVFHHPRRSAERSGGGGGRSASDAPLWPHCDHNPLLDEGQTRDWRVYQGVVSLWDSTDDHAATTVVWPGSHLQVYNALVAHAAPTINHHYVELSALHNTLPPPAGVDRRAWAADRQRRANWYRERFCQEGRRVPLRAGSLLLWDSRTVHQGWGPGERLAVPVCFEPKARRSQQALNRKMRLAAGGLPSTHWASLGLPHNQCNDDLYRAHPAIVEGVVCIRLPIGEALKSHALLESVTVAEARCACAALKATGDVGVAEAAAVAAMLKPEIRNLL